MAFDSSAPSTIIIGNSVRDSPLDPLVPEFLESSSALVEKYLGLNERFATEAFASAQDAIDAVSTAVMPRALPDPPSVPTLSSSFSIGGDIGFDDIPSLGSIVPSSLDAFVPADVPIEDVTDEIPTYTPLISGISIPDAPVSQPVTMPTAPTVSTDFDLPLQPDPSYGASPDLIEYVIPEYVAPVLPLFNETVPTMTESPPVVAIQWSEPVYSSAMKDAVSAVILEMLNGGTGLPAEVENAIWQRGREREDRRGEQEILSAMQQWTVRGFSHPPGQLNGQLIALRDMVGRKVNEVSREVMIEQANLEQKNRQFAVSSGLDFEKIFTNLFLQIVDRNFQIAKLSVETQIQLYNLAIAKFNVEQQIFAQQILLYRAQLEAAFAEIKAYEAQVGAVKAGAEMNIAMTQAFAEKVKAYAAEVDAFNGLVKAQVAKADMEKNKVDLYRAQIEGAVGQIQAQREVFMAYDSKIRGETSKVQLEEANTRAYVAQVQAIGEKAQVILKQADTHIARDRLRLDWNLANMQRITTLNAQQLTQIQANLSAFEAAQRKGATVYSSKVAGQQAQIQLTMENGRIQLGRFQALLEQWKVRSQEIIQMAEINAQSLRAAGQMAANLAAGAMAGTHVSAGISSQGNASQSSSRAVSDHTDHREAYDSNYTVYHKYDHKV